VNRAQGFYTKTKLPCPYKRVHLLAPVGFGTTKQLGFSHLVGIPLMSRVQQFFFTLDALPTVESNERIRESCREGSVLGSLKDLRVG